MYPGETCLNTAQLLNRFYININCKTQNEYCNKNRFGIGLPISIVKCPIFLFFSHIERSPVKTEALISSYAAAL